MRLGVPGVADVTSGNLMPTYTPEQDAALAAEIEKRRVAAATPPATADKGASVAAAPADKPSVDTTVPKDGSTTGDTDKGAKPPEAPALPDTFSDLPKELRSRIRVGADGVPHLVLDEEGLALTKSAVEAHATVTKLFTEKKANERDAENYRILADAIAEDHDLAAKVTKRMSDKRSGKKPEPAKPEGPEVPDEPDKVDWTDPKAITAFFDKRQARALAARDEAQAEALARDPENRKGRVNAALTVFAADNGVEMSTMKLAVEMAESHFQKWNEAHPDNRRGWDPNTVDVLMVPWVEAAKLKIASSPAPANKTAPASATNGTEEVASPVGRGGPHVDQPVAVPDFYVKGECPTRRLTVAEWERKELYEYQRRFGPNVTIEQIRAASKGR